MTHPNTLHIVTKLNDVRDDNTTYNNRLDTTLADVFSLLSLFFLTIGKTKDTPAAYSQIASMRVSIAPVTQAFPYQIATPVNTRTYEANITPQQILDHMNESAVYNESDLAPFHRRLGELRQLVQQDSKNPALTKLLERQLNECGSSFIYTSRESFKLKVAFLICLLEFYTDAIVRSLEESLSVLSVELIPIHEKLVTIRRQLVALAAKPESHKAELKPLQEELRRIDSLSTNFIHLIFCDCSPSTGGSSFHWPLLIMHMCLIFSLVPVSHPSPILRRHT